MTNIMRVYIYIHNAISNSTTWQQTMYIVYSINIYMYTCIYIYSLFKVAATLAVQQAQ